MWRVVNMDQTAYDGNLNRLMDCYNWSLASSPASVALGDAISANRTWRAVGLAIASGLVLGLGALTRTEHLGLAVVLPAALAIG